MIPMKNKDPYESDSLLISPSTCALQDFFHNNIWCPPGLHCVCKTILVTLSMYYESLLLNILCADYVSSRNVARN